MPRDTGQLLLVWAALLALLALTLAASFSPLGALKPAISLTIAAAKAALILWVFMRLREQGWLTRLIAVAALAWVALLAIMTAIDQLTRGLFPR